MFNNFSNKAFYKYIVPVLMLCFSVMFFESVNVQAEELYNYSYSLDYNHFSNSGSLYSKYQYVYNFSGDTKPIVFKIQNSGSSIDYVQYVFIVEIPSVSSVSRSTIKTY